MKNDIFLRRRHKVFFSPEGPPFPEADPFVATALANIQHYDYMLTFSPNLLAALRLASEAEIAALYKDMEVTIKKERGAHVQHEPMYPNFPTQVMNARQAELLINALLHYWSGGQVKQEYKKMDRPDLPTGEVSVPVAIDIGQEDEFVSIFVNMMKSPASLSVDDRTDLMWFLRHYRGALKCIPEKIPFKETAALVCAVIMEKAESESLEPLRQYLKTATDVLRLATAMSKGDVSLGENTKFKSFRRRERRILLNLLESLPDIEEDMARQPERWLRLGERLHPGEYSSMLKVNEAFHKLREGLPFNTFGGNLNRALATDLAPALKLLELRPGELARRLDSLLRSFDRRDEIIASFSRVAEDISTRVLLQVREHFCHRSQTPDPNNIFHQISKIFRLSATHPRHIRLFLPKGQEARAFYLVDRRPPIPEQYCMAVVDVCEKALLSLYAQRPPMGRVFVAKELANYLVPFSQRNASKALRTIARGSRIHISPKARTIRGFLWWRNGTDRTDLDLSAALLDEQWNYLEHISYTNLRSNHYQACHSGDIVDAPKGASEYIDLDVDSALRYGARYVVYCVFSFTCQPFRDLPECFMGWMEREEPTAGEIFEPPTVVQKIDLSSGGKICLPVIFDLKEKVFIWTDLGLTRNPNFNNNIESNKGTAIALCRTVAEMKKANLYDLIKLNISARGTEISDRNQADLIFDVDQGITPYDAELIMAEYL